MICTIQYLSAARFHDTFTSLNVTPDVIYPSLNSKTFDAQRLPIDPEGKLHNDNFTILSINRYERKKNLPLALKTLGKPIIV